MRDGERGRQIENYGEKEQKEWLDNTLPDPHPCTTENKEEEHMPRQCGRLTQRPNYQSKTVEEYYRVAIFNPYLDAIIKSLGTRFVPDNKNHFVLFSLHPVLTSQVDRNNFRVRMI